MLISFLFLSTSEGSPGFWTCAPTVVSLKIFPNEIGAKIRVSLTVKLSKNLHSAGHKFSLHDLQLLKIFSYLFHAQAHSWIYFSQEVTDFITDCRLPYISFSELVLSPFHDEMNCK